MAQISIVKKASVFAIIALSAAATVSAQAMAPAPSPDAGLGFSVPVSGVVIGSSMILSFLDWPEWSEERPAVSPPHVFAAGERHGVRMCSGILQRQPLAAGLFGCVSGLCLSGGEGADFQQLVSERVRQGRCSSSSLSFLIGFVQTRD
ncbi:hypothetical protein LXL04_036289 [Taraxacum kok-saghyz]